MLRVTKLTKTTAVASLLAAVAITAPSASARPIDYVPSSTHSSYSRAPEAYSPATRVEIQESAFDWGDAALGAAGTLSVLGLATGAVVIGRRRAETSPNPVG